MPLSYLLTLVLSSQGIIVTPRFNSTNYSDKNGCVNGAHKTWILYALRKFDNDVEVTQIIYFYKIDQ